MFREDKHVFSAAQAIWLTRPGAVTSLQGMTKEQAFDLVKEELERSTRLFGDMQSPHEGISVLREEFEELWEEVKSHKGGRGRMGSKGRAEAVQVAAMALRFILDCTSDEPAKD
jgi:hypothetical protein